MGLSARPDGYVDHALEAVCDRIILDALVSSPDDVPMDADAGAYAIAAENLSAAHFAAAEGS